jgi:hypothetical protein
MKQIIIYSLLTFLFVACTQKKSAYRGIASVNRAPTSLAGLLDLRRNEIYSWMLECPGPNYQGQISDLPGQCYQEDVISWSGYSCLSAQLAGDSYIANKRCRDVGLAQGVNGRWWRGQSRINNNPTNSFSRDMSLGVIDYFIAYGMLSNDKSKAVEVRDKAIAWAQYISNNHGGKKFCNDATDSRCNIMGQSGHTLRKIMERIGAYNPSTQHLSIFNHLRTSPQWLVWYAELQTVPVGFQTHLKAQDILQRYVMGLESDAHYKTAARIIFNKDRKNLFYEFLYSGVNPGFVDRLFLRCPAVRPTTNDHTVYHQSLGGWQWQRPEVNKEWEVANGHDCIFLINLSIAALKGKLTLPWVGQSNTNVCQGKARYLGSYNNLDVCKAVPHFNISRVKCDNVGVHILPKNGDRWCLINKGHYFKARKVVGECPNSDEYLFDKNGVPVCGKKGGKRNISLYKCVDGNHPTYPDWNPPFQHCFENKGSYFEMKNINRLCPIPNPFQNEYYWSKWPICKGFLKIKRSNCNGENVDRGDHCLVRMGGWFSKRNFLAECPFGMTSTNIYKDQKPLCKPIPHFRIRGNKCNNKGGQQWSGWCLWDKGAHYKARQLK